MSEKIRRVSLVSGMVVGRLSTQPGMASWFDQLESAAETAVEQAAIAVLRKQAGTTPDNGEQSARPAVSTAPASVPSQPRYDHTEVRAIQERLNALDYRVGHPDGLYGPGPRRGIENFQHDHGLRVTGSPTPRLRGQVQAGSGTRAER